MKRCAFVTFGCKVNQYDTQAIREACERQGLRAVAEEEPAEVYVINTCSVTQAADREALRLIRRLRRRNASAQIIVTGCLVDRKVKQLDGVDLIVPSRQKHLIASLIADESLRRAFQPCFEGGYSPLSVSQFFGHTRSFVKIQDGCNYNCSFCKIPQVRGRSISRPLSEIVEEVGRLVAVGYRELVLTGVSLGNYGREWRDGPGLVEVVESLAQVAGLARLRLSSVEPSDTTPRLLEVMASSPVVCRHLHLPLQSGSDRILRLMRRHYTAQAYRELIEHARHTIPGLNLTTDVIVGFPTETDEDHEQTEALLESVRPIRTHLFPYSRRKGTWAATIPESVSPHVVKTRMDRLRRLQDALTSRHLEQLVGSELEVLIEGPGTNSLEGYSDTYVRCLIEAPQALQSRLIPLDFSQSVRLADRESDSGCGPLNQLRTAEGSLTGLIRVRVTKALRDHVLAQPL